MYFLFPLLPIIHSNILHLVFGSCQWGGALSSFDTLDTDQPDDKSAHLQGVFGVPLDHFLDNINFTPNHIKIDVDGNEHLILLGAHQTLLSHHLKVFLLSLMKHHQTIRIVFNYYYNPDFSSRKIPISDF